MGRDAIRGPGTVAAGIWLVAIVVAAAVLLVWWLA